MTPNKLFRNFTGQGNKIMEKQKEFTIFVGQLGLGECSEEEKKEFLKWINKELENRGYGEQLVPLTNKEIKTKGLEWLNREAISRLADIMQIIGFSYWLLPSHIKEKINVDYFVKKAKEWVEKYKK